MTNETWGDSAGSDAGFELTGGHSETRESAAPASETGEIAIARGDAWRASAEALSDLGVGCARIDDEGLVSSVNAAMTAMVGCAARAVIGAHLADFVDAEDATAVRGRIHDALAGLADVAPLGARVRHASGRWTPVELTMRSVETQRGGRRAALVFAASTAARDEVLSLRRALGSALDAIRQRDDLFALAAHELRSPLTPLSLHLQATLRTLDADPASVRRSLVAAESQVKRITHLVEQLLDVARVRAGRLVLDKQRADLAVIVRDAAARFTGECVRAGTAIDLACPAPVIGQWDALRVDQIVTNLISNAVKYAPGAPIQVSLREEGHRAILAVRDGGAGIPAGQLARIFDRFERGPGECRARGAGLGLWIVRQLVDAHGGHVHVESAPGAGATFFVELPRS